MTARVTSEVVVAYSQCPRKGFLLLCSDRQARRHEYEAILEQQRQTNQTRYLEALSKDHPDATAYGPNDVRSGKPYLMSVATQKSPLVAIVRLLVRGQMGQFLLPEEQVLPVSARPSRGRGLGNRRQVLHEWGPLAGHQWGFLHGHVHPREQH